MWNLEQSSDYLQRLIEIARKISDKLINILILHTSGLPVKVKFHVSMEIMGLEQHWLKPTSHPIFMPRSRPGFSKRIQQSHTHLISVSARFSTLLRYAAATIPSRPCNSVRLTAIWWPYLATWSAKCFSNAISFSASERSRVGIGCRL